MYCPGEFVMRLIGLRIQGVDFLMRRISILTPIIAVVAIAALRGRMCRARDAYTGSPEGGSYHDSHPGAESG